MRPRRSLLFVPGARPDRFAKALGAGADMVCVDLEDAVPPEGKDAARAAAIEWISTAEGAGPERVVRINALRSLAGLRDLAAMAEAAPRAGLVFLPKVDGPEELRLAEAILAEARSPMGLVALIETVAGLENVQRIASATPRLEAVMFGAVDLAAELACDLAWEPLLYARSRIVHAARQAGIDAIDVPSLEIRNSAAIETAALRARALGFTGKAVLHPDDVAAVNAAFSPSPEETEAARRVVAAFEASETGLVVLDGKLVEKPVIRKMEQVLAAARAAGAL